jgi:hypothetical protein
MKNQPEGIKILKKKNWKILWLKSSQIKTLWDHFSEEFFPLNS